MTICSKTEVQKTHTISPEGSANHIRSAFLDYFVKEGHQETVSSPLVPRNDPSLMFTNSGMVQFKNVFTGQEPPPTERAVTAQKCVRAGGKHNDLENVGYTARHHTFFEMLGNFSFGDYFKERAIELAWGLLTRDFSLPKDKLLVTVHSSDEEAGLLWRKIAGLPEDRIIRISTSDNFWSMGALGPCGPCTEIFYDHGQAIAGGPPGSANEDGDRYIEIWNLVFMQFDQITSDERKSLPRPCVDTGMGLERIAAVLQGKSDNYDVDHIRALVVAAAEGAGVEPDGDHNTSLRVIADHLRCAGFLIADGVTPSNEGRGYVLRRIMRRAMRHVHLTGCTEPLMARLVPELMAQMAGHYHELQRAEPLIRDTLYAEEVRFRKTLERGLRLLADETAKLGDGGVLSGATAFKLYDTYGFPLDLTCDALRNEGKGVDLEGFEIAMEAQKTEARRHWSGSGESANLTALYDIVEAHGSTEFLGYDTDRNDGKIIAILKNGELVDALASGETGHLIINQTPFYAESGGQLADFGEILLSSGNRFDVIGVQKQLGLWLHEVVLTSETECLRVGDTVTLCVDNERRSALRANHSATHLLHAALRSRLGNHVTQKGSLVAPDRLRFDISHPNPIGQEDLDAVETEVNRQICGNTAVETRIMTSDDAIDAGAMALFGEKYGDEVRVVSMGGAISEGGAVLENGSVSKDNPKQHQSWSMELCGGLHVASTGEIGTCVIVSEQAVAAGIRRIEALTGMAAWDHLRAQRTGLQNLSVLLKVPPQDMVERLQGLIYEQRSLQNEMSELRRRLAISEGGETCNRPQTVAGLKVVSRVLEDIPPRDMKPLAEKLLVEAKSDVVILVSHAKGKISLVVAVDKEQSTQCSAIDLVRTGAQALGGTGGGGRPDMAQAGGDGNGEDCLKALTAISEEISQIMNT